MTIATGGQGALRVLPSYLPSTKTLSSYDPPKKLQSEQGYGGIDVIKLSKGGKPQHRTIVLSENNRKLLVTTNRIRSIKDLVKYALPQKKEIAARSIDISTIDRVQRSQHTKRFNLARSKRSPGSDESLPDGPANALSIVYRESAASSGFSISEGISVTTTKSNGVTPYQTLDLIVPSTSDYEMLATTLETLVSIYKEEQNVMDRNLLLLEYHWVELDKELSDLVSLNEWIQICDKLNVPLKKSVLTSYFKEFARELGLEEAQISLPEAAAILEILRIKSLKAIGQSPSDEAYSQIWNEVRNSDPMGPTEDTTENAGEEETISAVAFLSFIRSHQKEFKASLDEVKDIFFKLNSQLNPMDLLKSESDGVDRAESIRNVPNNRITKSKFISYLVGDANDLFDPCKGKVGVNNMNRPLNHYWINTSHDTYLAPLYSCYTHAPMDKLMGHSETDLDMYHVALYRGARCLELDVFDPPYDGPEPVVGRRGMGVDTGVKSSTPSSPRKMTMSKSVIRFSDVIRVVRSFLLSYPDTFPIILNIENHCSIDYQEIMADNLRDILGSTKLLHDPSTNTKGIGILPSPESLRGKVIVKGKIPMREGATIVNDDFDDENDFLCRNDADSDEEDISKDDEDEDYIKRFVDDFESSNLSNKEGFNPAEILRIANQEAQTAKEEAKAAEARYFDMKITADTAEDHALSLLTQAGLSLSDVEETNFPGEETLNNSPLNQSRKTALGEGTAPMSNEISRGTQPALHMDQEEDEEGLEVELIDSHTTAISSELISSTPPTKKKTFERTDQGMEVQDFFGNSVDDARSNYAKADTALLGSSQKAINAQREVIKKKQELSAAREVLENARHREQELTMAAKRAANAARSNREHADTAQSRVRAVQQLVDKAKDQAGSSETVVVTALAEAKISEERAKEAETRASRALATAEKDRARADSETKKEETLEREVIASKKACNDSNSKIASSRRRLDEAKASLSLVKDHLKIIEGSAEFRNEKKGFSSGTSSDDDDHTNKRSARNTHIRKKEEKKELEKLVKELSTESEREELTRRRNLSVYEEKAREAKACVKLASSARRQADHSAIVAEQLAEHAEEEREAADLRKVAKERAELGVEHIESHLDSYDAQLAEAKRAAEETSYLAAQSRLRAEELAKEAEEATDRDRQMQDIDIKRKALLHAEQEYKIAAAERDTSEYNVSEAKRLLEMSSEVLSSAQVDAAAESHRAHAEEHAQQSAISAYRKANFMRKHAEDAKVLASFALTNASDKARAARQTLEYKEKKAKVAEISANLASLTFLHSSRLKYWKKSLALRCCHMHSVPEGKIRQIIRNQASRTQLIEFSKTHLLRTFPSPLMQKSRSSANFNPILPWSTGSQMVAMDHFACDDFLLVNDGFFRQNGSTGYVLKPDRLTRQGIEPSPKENEERWNFRVLSGYCLPKPELEGTRKGLTLASFGTVHPRVRITLFDGLAGGQEKRPITYTTQTVSKNGLNPVWNNTSGMSVTVSSPSTAVFLFSVWNHSDENGTDDFIAAASIPASCLREGYRSIPLFDSQHKRCGAYSFASLLVKAIKEL